MQTNTNDDLLVLCVPYEQKLLASPRKIFLCPYDQSAIIIEICIFAGNFSLIEVVLYADVSKNRFLKLKITLMGWTYPGQPPLMSPPLSLHFLLV